MLDAKALADATAEIVRGHVSNATAPLLKRIEELEARQPERGEKGDIGPSGANVTNAVIDRSGVLIFTLSDGSALDVGVVVGKDGRDGTDNVLNEGDAASLLAASLADELRGCVIDLPPPLPMIAHDKAAPVNVNIANHIPRQRKERTTVTRHDNNGRIAEFERHYED